MFWGPPGHRGRTSRASRAIRRISGYIMSTKKLSVKAIRRPSGDQATLFVLPREPAPPLIHECGVSPGNLAGISSFLDDGESIGIVLRGDGTVGPYELEVQVVPCRGRAGTYWNCCAPHERSEYLLRWT